MTPSILLLRQVFDIGAGTLDLALLHIPANWSLAGKFVCSFAHALHLLHEDVTLDLFI
jgi:hypothetical protein